MTFDMDEPPPVRTTLAWSVLRIVAGVILAAHGFQKLSDFATWQGHVEKLGIPFPPVSAALAVAGEFLGGLGLVVGLFTRVAAFGALCTMVVAIALVHWKAGLFAKDGGFEYPLTLAAIAFAFMLTGAGRFSLDQALIVRARRKAIASDARFSQPPYVPSPSSQPPPYEPRIEPTQREPLNPGYRG